MKTIGTVIFWGDFWRRAVKSVLNVLMSQKTSMYFGPELRFLKRSSLGFVGDNPQRKADESKQVQQCFCEVRFLILCFLKSFASFLFAHYINKRVLAAGRFSGSLLWCMKPIEPYFPEVRFLVSFKLVTCSQLSFYKREWAHSLLVLETVCKESPE